MHTLTRCYIQYCANRLCGAAQIDCAKKLEVSLVSHAERR